MGFGGAPPSNIKSKSIANVCIYVYEEVSKKKVVTVHFGGFSVVFPRRLVARTPRSDFLQLLPYTEPEKKIQDFLNFFRIF